MSNDVSPVKYSDSEEINIKHTLLWFSQASYMKEKRHMTIFREPQSDVQENLPEFCQISLKILPYLTDFSPQIMACMKSLLTNASGILHPGLIWSNSNPEIQNSYF